MVKCMETTSDLLNLCILILAITNWWPTRKYETSTIILLTTSYSPPTVFHWSVIFLCNSCDNFSSFCPMTSSVTQIYFDIYMDLVLDTVVFAPTFLFLGVLFWFNSWSGRAYVFKKGSCVHALFLAYMRTCAFWFILEWYFDRM